MGVQIARMTECWQITNKYCLDNCESECQILECFSCSIVTHEHSTDVGIYSADEEENVYYH